MTKDSHTRNPGPPWGFRVIHFWNRVLPNPLQMWVRNLCAWVAMAVMTRQRKASREYMSALLGRPATLRDCANQFKSFVHYLCDRVDTAYQREIHFDWAEGHGLPFTSIIHQPGALLLGTFHVGYSDLMGFFTQHFKKRIHMLRLRLENSEDTERLEAQAGEYLKILWVNDIQDTLYTLKNVIHEKGVVAMQCDRVQHASKLQGIDFLGKKRLFPFTIYLLSILFNAPVLFVIAGIPDPKDGIVPVYTSTVYRPVHGNKTANLSEAKAHFQSVISLLETLLREKPGMWFNFEPLNPVEND